MTILNVILNIFIKRLQLRSNGPQMDGYFEIDPVSGTVRLLKCLDFESVTEYSFIVTAKVSKH